ncbi:MAG TPA: acyltransferase [Chitinophagaceae bacterium]|nr:acyltransferase [Chitinophagaceae bacterium]
MSHHLSDGQVSPKVRIFFPNLDGLRFFCFLSVFLYHSFATDYTDVKSTGLYYWVKNVIATNGNLGVNFFFVLSGFLITYLLLAEKESFGNIKVGNFYIRRILRIWPLFYFCVFFGFVVFPWLKTAMGQVPAETAHLGCYLTFLNNFDFIKNGLPDASVLGILWSVAIEEQFYLFWPLILYVCPSRYYHYLFVSIILVSLGFRFYYAENWLILEMHTLACISDMTVGALAALLAYGNKRFLELITQTPKWVIVLLYTVTLGAYLYRQELFYHGPLLLAADRLVMSVLFAWIILEQNFSTHSLFKLSRFKLISKLGTYTYGLYCLHMIGILITAKGLARLGWNKNVYQVIFLEGILSLLITIGLALVSFHLFERRFLKFKDKFARITKYKI